MDFRPAQVLADDFDVGEEVFWEVVLVGFFEVVVFVGVVVGVEIGLVVGVVVCVVVGLVVGVVVGVV